MIRFNGTMPHIIISFNLELILLHRALGQIPVYVQFHAVLSAFMRNNGRQSALFCARIPFTTKDIRMPCSEGCIQR